MTWLLFGIIVAVALFVAMILDVFVPYDNFAFTPWVLKFALVVAAIAVGISLAHR